MVSVVISWLNYKCVLHCSPTLNITAVLLRVIRSIQVGHIKRSCSSMFGSELRSRQSATWQPSPVRLTPPLPANRTAEGRVWACLLLREIQSQRREPTVLARPGRGTCIPACKLPLGGERKCLENIYGSWGKDSRYETHLCRDLFRSLSWNI